MPLSQGHPVVFGPMPCLRDPTAKAAGCDSATLTEEGAMRIRRILMCMTRLLAGCGGGGGGDGAGGSDAMGPTGEQGSGQGDVESPGWFRPVLGASWQWPLLGTVNTGCEVDIYDVDLFDSSPELIAQLHQAGRSVICYFSAGSFEGWRPDAAAFSEAAKGKPLEGFA